MSGDINISLTKLEECKSNFENLLQAHQHGSKNLKKAINYESGYVYMGMKSAFDDMVLMSDKMEIVIKNTISFIQKTKDKMEKEDLNAGKQFE